MQSYDSYEIVVVAPLSTCELRSKILDDPRIIFVANREEGLAAARNLGMKVARGDVLAFIDDDVIASFSWLENIAKDVATGADIVGGPIEPLYLSSPPDWWREDLWGDELGINRCGGRVYHETIFGGNFAVTRALIQLIGGFNPLLGRRGKVLYSNEETDLIRRASMAGFRTHFDEKVSVKHVIPPSKLTYRYLWKSSYYQGVSDALMVWLERPTKLLRQLLRTAGEIPHSLAWFLSTPYHEERVSAIMHTSWRLGFVLSIFHIGRLVSRKGSPPIASASAASLSCLN